MISDKTLFALVVSLMSISVVMVFSLSTYATIIYEVSEFHFVIRQAMFVFAGSLLILILSLLNPDRWLNFIGFSLLIIPAILIVAMPFLPESYVSAVGGAKRWIKIFSFSFSPVEFFKIGFVYFLAWSFSRKIIGQDALRLFLEIKRFLPYAFVFIFFVFMIAFVQNDLGQVVVLGFTMLGMLILSESSKKFVSSILGLVLILFTIFIITKNHRIDRIKQWWALTQDSILSIFPPSVAEKLRVVVEKEPYQVGHSLNSIYNGGFFGTGLSNGTFKLGFLGEIHTDFILAGIAEELGFMGILLVVFIFMWILFRISSVANRTLSDKGYLFSLGIGIVLSVSFLVNAYGISGIIPLKGMPIPFLSYGGSSMLGASFGIGMVLMVAKQKKVRV